MLGEIGTRTLLSIEQDTTENSNQRHVNCNKMKNATQKKYHTPNFKIRLSQNAMDIDLYNSRDHGRRF